MFDFTDSQNIDKEYNGFILLSVDDLTEIKAKGVYLRHKRTGLEVYHIVKDDKENLFAFAFRTIAKDSKGTAHIMEHSTLCGSEKYPLKEPFTTLASQSLNTFLNALTYPDKTVYPGASLVKSDYFNMMDVYCDSVFFPKLDYTTFIQEGHRLEMDEKGNLSIQGVVYNEMKGEYSSFTQIAYGDQIAAMYPDSFPAFESGGDPLYIPTLTYQEFLDFHQKFYNPDNCLLFLYGDIPTGEQLDFLNDNFMPRIEKKYNCVSEVQNPYSKTPVLKPEIKELQKLSFVKESKEIYSIAPEQGATGSLVTMNWYSGPANIEKTYLSEVLCGNDSSPVSKALKDSKLGDELSCGNYGQFQEEFFNFGICGVKKGKEKKVYAVIENTLKKLIKEGIPKEHIDSAIMGMDFNLREVNRYFGPYSITLMSRTLKGWGYGNECKKHLSPITAFEEVKAKIREDKDFTVNLIKKYFFGDGPVIKFVAEPSDKYFARRNKAEAETVAKLEANLDKDKLKQELEALHAYQQKIETPEEISCMPHTKISELSSTVEQIPLELKFVDGKEGAKIPLFVSEEETNGLFYIDVLFPFDNLDVSYYKYIPFFADILSDLGWNGKSWDACIAEATCITGDIWGRTSIGTYPDYEISKKHFEKYKEYNFCGRQWLGLACKALTSHLKESLDLMATIITTMDFKDKERLKSLIQEYIADKKYGLVQSGREYASRRTRAAISENYSIAEIFYGVTQLNTVNKEYLKPNLSKLLQTFQYIYDEIRKAGAIVHITADSESLKKLLPEMEAFVGAAELKALVPGKKHSLQEYIAEIFSSDELQKADFTEVLKTETQTGYGAMSVPLEYKSGVEEGAANVLSSWLDMHLLWDKIRTTGGAYGASSLYNGLEKLMTISSYRDPTPEKSVEVYKEVLKQAAELDYSDEDIERTIVSLYGECIIPLSPKERGRSAFDSFLFGTYGLKNYRIQNLLKVTSEDVKNSAKQLYENSKETCHKAVFCDNSTICSGKILNLPL